MSFNIQKTAASAWSTIRKNLDLNAAKHLLTAFAGTYSDPSLSEDRICQASRKKIGAGQSSSRNLTVCRKRKELQPGPQVEKKTPSTRTA
jgi:hypothetical protein